MTFKSRFLFINGVGFLKAKKHRLVFSGEQTNSIKGIQVENWKVRQDTFKYLRSLREF